MKALLITFLAACPGLLYSREQSSNDDDFEKELNEGYNRLKNVPNEADTVKFLRELHNMEDEIKNELAQAPQQLPSEIVNHLGTKVNHIEPMGDTIEEVNHNSKVDTALFQGDIVLTKKQAEELMEDIKANRGNRSKRQAFRDSRYPETLWTNRNVYFSYGWNATEAAKRVFRKAAYLWSTQTCIAFGESSTAKDRITLIKSDGCWSYVGRIGGEQVLSLGNGCESVGTAAHEIGHALGFYHEQSRHDRDSFITLYTQNFKAGWISQFSKETEKTNYNYNLTYDYGSIMQYGARSVSRDGKPIMVPHDIKYMQTLGSPMISLYDKLMMNMHYGCLDRCNQSSTSAKCENGGFPNPRDCAKCICPSGYGGTLCNERPAGCGKTLTATTSYQTLEDVVGDKNALEAFDDFIMCHYWIEAPAGSKIEVVLDSYTTDLAVDGCRYGGVEIKTGSDIRHTGYRFCAEDNIGTSLISTRNIVPVITYSRFYEAKTVLRYRIASSGPEIPQTTARPKVGSTGRQTVGPTGRPTVGRTVRPTKGPKSRTTPILNCVDRPSCRTIVKMKFCETATEAMKRSQCPVSCGLC